jgi:hypothetical protein
VNAVHILITSFFKIHFNIILPSAHRSAKWYIFFMFWDFYMHFSSLLCMLHTLFIISSCVWSP